MNCFRTIFPSIIIFKFHLQLSVSRCLSQLSSTNWYNIIPTICFMSIGWSRLALSLAIAIGTHLLTSMLPIRLSTQGFHTNPSSASLMLISGHQVTRSIHSNITVEEKHTPHLLFNIGERIHNKTKGRHWDKRNDQPIAQPT